MVITAILQTSTCGESPGSLVAMHVGKGWFSRAEREESQCSKIQYVLHEYVGLQCVYLNILTVSSFASRIAFLIADGQQIA